jgi:hypothetical protein
VSIPYRSPTIIVEDHSETPSIEETEWKESVIRNALQTKLPEKESSKEDTGLLELLREALQVAKDAEGLIPIAQVDHVYQAVKTHRPMTSSAKFPGKMEPKLTGLEPWTYCRMSQPFPSDVINNRVAGLEPGTTFQHLRTDPVPRGEKNGKRTKSP